MFPMYSRLYYNDEIRYSIIIKVITMSISLMIISYFMMRTHRKIYWITRIKYGENLQVKGLF